jgi:hypothetical protein
LKVAVSVHGAGLSDGEAKDAAFATCKFGVELTSRVDTSHLQGEPGLIRAFHEEARRLARQHGVAQRRLNR